MQPISFSVFAALPERAQQWPPSMTAKLNPSQLQSYLDAIQLPDENMQPTLATLTAVHRQHSRNIPFANVTVAREPPLLIELSFPKETPGTSTDAIMEKLAYKKWYESLAQNFLV